MTWTWLGIAALGFVVLTCIVGYRRGFIKEIVSTFIVVLTIGVVWLVNPYVNEFLRENTPVYERVKQGCEEVVSSWEESLNEKGKSGQEALIEEISLPASLKEDLLKNNTFENYSYLSADTFMEYISNYFAVMIVNGISFLVSFVLVTILIRIITYALDILSKLPVINGANKIAGALVGGIKSILFLWILFLIITVLCNTQIGRSGLELIEKDYFLNFLYGKNILAQIFTSIFYGK